jgi:UDP-N-acetylmuramoyl-L-alanyl-D-glutamate--2,6-diaminopimelate ligase
MNREFSVGRSKPREKSKADFDLHELDKLGVRISNLATDSRAVKPGDTFLAYPGEKRDGREFIPQAISAGANAVLWTRHGNDLICR